MEHLKKLDKRAEVELVPASNTVVGNDVVFENTVVVGDIAAEVIALLAVFD